MRKSPLNKTNCGIKTHPLLSPALSLNSTDVTTHIIVNMQVESGYCSPSHLLLYTTLHHPLQESQE